MKLFLALYTVLMVGTASAAQITAEPLGPPAAVSQAMIIRVSGQFHLGDDRKFIEAALPHKHSIVIFGNSPGGSLDAAIGIGQAIKILRLPTSVAANAECASACAFAWLAGHERYMEPNARLGFHAASQDGKLSGSANALLGAYLNELDLSTEAIIYLTDTEPESMIWLDFSQVNTMGITVKESAATETVANVEPTPAPTQEKPKPVVTMLTSGQQWDWNCEGQSIHTEIGDNRLMTISSPDDDDTDTLSFLYCHSSSRCAWVFDKARMEAGGYIEITIDSDTKIPVMYINTPFFGSRLQGRCESKTMPEPTVPPPTYLPSSKYWHVRPGIDLYGHDMRAGLVTQSRETCQTQCRDNGECRAYTFNTRNNMCFIKSDIGRAYKNAAAISGYWGELTKEIKESEMVIREEIDYPDADPALQVVDYAHHKNVSFDWCLQECEVDDYCKAFTYVHRIRDCWLKSNAVRSGKSRKGVTSGIKESAKRASE
jgi:hypothetical protein